MQTSISYFQQLIEILEIKTGENREYLNNTMKQEDLIDLHKEHFTQHVAESFSSTHTTFTKINHILNHKTNLNKFLKTGLIQNMFSDHNKIKPEKIQ